MKELEGLKGTLRRFDEFAEAVKTAEELSALAASPEDERDVLGQLSDLDRQANALEIEAVLGGEYDRNDALVSIHAGAGGVDAQDWAEMLLRMYLRWAEREGFRTDILDESRGTEAGLKSVTFSVAGEFAYGYLRSEAGVHRLVRLSPFNANQLRQTSFALVEVVPEIDDAETVKIRPEDLRVDTYRSSGAGGQHVNKTESAVRLTHLPTGIVVACQSERSQIQNREQAMRLLQAKLFQRAKEEQSAKERELKGEHKSAEWGNQIRSYVLHPYTLAKDHRTKHETPQVHDVLDGELRPFMEAHLRREAARRA